MKKDAPHSAGGSFARAGIKLTAFVALGFAALGLFARMMAYPLRHDEQIYLPAGILFTSGDLYQDFSFNHLPNLPLLLGGIFALTGSSHYLLVGRIVIFMCWIATVAALALIAHRYTRSPLVAAFAALLVVTNVTLLGNAGMLVTNNLIPVPFALFGLYFFLRGVDHADPDWRVLVLAGAFLALAIGFKANYVFVLPPFVFAALFVPTTVTFRRRLSRVLLPMLAGGLIGGAPTLYYLLTDPAGLIAHTVRWHRTAHVAFWAASDEPKVVSLSEKLLLAESVWLAGSALLIPLAAVFFAMVIVARKAGGETLRRSLSWPILLTASLVGLGMVVAFVPTPSFPQYYVPPIGFGIGLVILLYAQLELGERAGVGSFLYAAMLIAFVAGASRLAADLTKLGAPREWTGLSVHETATRIGGLVRLHGGRGKLATLSPVYALEGGLQVYPELAAGPFIYRTADLIPEQDRRHYRLVSEATLPAFLDADPPAGILVGLEGAEDRGLRDYALTHGYRKIALQANASRYGTLSLYVRSR